MRLSFASRSGMLHLLVVADEEQVEHDGEMYRIAALWSIESLKSWLLDLMCITGLEEIRAGEDRTTVRWSHQEPPTILANVAASCGTALDPGGGRTIEFRTDQLAWHNGHGAILLPLGRRQVVMLVREVVLALGFVTMQVREREDGFALTGCISPAFPLHGPLPPPLMADPESPWFWWRLLKAACGRRSFWERAARGEPSA